MKVVAFLLCALFCFGGLGGEGGKGTDEPKPLVLSQHNKTKRFTPQNKKRCVSNYHLFSIYMGGILLMILLCVYASDHPA